MFKLQRFMVGGKCGRWYDIDSAGGCDDDILDWWEMGIGRSGSGWREAMVREMSDDGAGKEETDNFFKLNKMVNFGVFGEVVVNHGMLMREV